MGTSSARDRTHYGDEMTAKELAEKYQGQGWIDIGMYDEADEFNLILAALRAYALRNEIIEECALAAEAYGEAHYDPHDPGNVDVTVAIRALKTTVL